MNPSPDDDFAIVKTALERAQIFCIEREGCISHRISKALAALERIRARLYPKYEPPLTNEELRRAVDLIAEQQKAKIEGEK